MGRELPPKSTTTLALLNKKRQRIDEELRPCRGTYSWNDERRALDVLRTYVCDIYDCLKETYSLKVSSWEWEQEIAEEAINVTLGCWKSYNLGAHYSQLIEPLRRAVVLHIGHSLRSGSLQQPSTTSQAAAVSPTSVPIPADTTPSSVQKAPTHTFADELKRFLEEAQWKPEDVAEKINTGWRIVYKHLNGSVIPSTKTRWAYERELTKRLGRKVMLPKKTV